MTCRTATDAYYFFTKGRQFELGVESTDPKNGGLGNMEELGYFFYRRCG
jgi:hypothetical protein